MRNAIRLACLWLLGAGIIGCAEDTVYPGFYGQPAMSEQSIKGAASGAAGAGSGAPLSGAGASGSGTSGTTGALPIAGTGGASGMASEGTGGASGMSAEAGGPAPSEPMGGACDLSGRWLATLHYVTDAIGQLQTVHTYLYYEIAATDGGFAITKGLHCGDDVIAEGLFAVEGDFSSSAAASTQRLSYVGRPVSSTPSGSGCDVHFGKWYTVVGATYPHYTDPSLALPTIDQQASGTTPGWEDWDQDGNPGISIRLTGIIAGKVFVASRSWSEAHGTVSRLGDRFQIPLQWNQEKNVIGYEGSELLASDAVRAADPNLHFVELARLDPAQATGDDLTICRAVVDLAPALTPAASAL